MRAQASWAQGVRAQGVRVQGVRAQGYEGTGCEAVSRTDGRLRCFCVGTMGTARGQTKHVCYLQGCLHRGSLSRAKRPQGLEARGQAWKGEQRWGLGRSPLLDGAAELQSPILMWGREGAGGATP